MKTGWVISINDKLKKEKAHKVIFGDREIAKSEIESLSERYKDKFKMAANTPYSEIIISDRAVIKCILPAGMTSQNILSLLYSYSPFLRKQEGISCYVEVNRSGLEEISQLLQDRITYKVQD
jgi:hypothetical protein